MLLLSGLEQLPPQVGPFPKPHWMVGVLVAALAGGGQGESLAVLASDPSSASRLPGPLSTCVQCLILAFLFSGLGFAGFSAMAKPGLPESSLWKLPFGWGWAPGEASAQLSLGGWGGRD